MKKFKLILYGFKNDILEINISPLINGNKKTQIVNSIIQNIYIYFSQHLHFDGNKLYVYAEGSFEFLNKFKFKHLHELNDETPLIVIYTDVFLL